MKILNLYAGIGGNRKLWGDEHEVTAVENNEKIAKIYKDLFPKDQVIIADAHEYLLEHHKEFDFIWSSPPCPTHSVCNNFLYAQGCISKESLEKYFGKSENTILKEFAELLKKEFHWSKTKEYSAVWSSGEINLKIDKLLKKMDALHKDGE
jgi:site-specific DNA-cytosine methylase